jgi:hypothetical protein
MSSQPSTTPSQVPRGACAPGPERTLARGAFGFVVGISVAWGLSGCASPPALQGWEVTLVAIVDCTKTNLTVDCVDEDVLAQTAVTARWIVEHSETGIGIAVTTHQGETLAGWRFANDKSIAELPGCAGEGGECSFARRRTSSSDGAGLGCQRETALALAAHTPLDEPDRLQGFWSNVAVATEECGTATTTEQTWSVVGRRVDEVVLARERAP